MYKMEVLLLELTQIIKDFFGIDAFLLFLVIIAVIISFFYIICTEKNKELAIVGFIIVIIASILCFKFHVISQSYKMDYYINNIQEMEEYLQDNEEDIDSYTYENNILSVYVK